ncbi:HAD family hydrolase [Halorarius halobius]|uniref:HAD family hydrolase n=1 Tax=Halorarius halobius TaxID=2962671 RepID=UPI0020CEA4B6|nr:HAD hydrolase-like protein [Halorarius halobius]
MEYDAVVYDLDNTLVELAVDWEAVRQEVADALDARGLDPEGDIWSMVSLAEENGHYGAVENVLSDHERAGARDAVRLPAADLLPHDVPVGVCSLNCETACREALERHELDPHVGSVVGRDSGPWRKPAGEPLLAALDPLGVDPESAVFVGDSDSDAETAANAGTAFSYVRDWL